MEFQDSKFDGGQQGKQYDLMAGSPAMMKQIYRREHQRHEQQLWLQGLQGPHTHGKEVQHLITKGGIEFEGARKLFTSRNKKLLLQPGEKALLRTLMAGKVPTGTRRFAWGQQESPLCECGAEDDTFHRLWVCPKGKEARDKGFKQGYIDEMILAGPSLHNTRGWIPRLERFKPDEDPQWRYWIDGEEVDRTAFPGLLTETLVYLDGSCMNPSLEGWAIAGAACVQQQGHHEVAITSSIPADFEQTAATAEHIAALMFHQTAAAGGVEAVVDCASVHRSFQNKAWAQGERRPFGGLWRQCGPQQHKATKTKAHRTKDDGDGHFEGNEAADRWAKKAALMSSPSLTKARDHQLALQGHMKELRGMIHTLQAWPSEIWRKKFKDKAPKPPRKTRHDFLYAWGRRMFICRTCCKGAKTRGRLNLKPCAPFGQSRASHYQRIFSLGHKLMELGPAGGLYFCNLCGCYTEGRGRGLQKPCRKRLSTQLAKVKIMSKGLHPITKKVYGEIHRIWLPVLEAARSGDDTQEEITSPGLAEVSLASQDIIWAREQNWDDD